MTQNFAELGLSPQLVAGLERAGFTTPTPIQAQAIPPQLAGHDILGIAQTGSGKTAAFALPILAGLAGLTGHAEPKTTRALILAPTRELAVQIDEVLHALAGTQRLSTVLVLGGVSRGSQVQKIARGVDVVIATPGRLLDLVDDNKLRLDHTRWLVLDEADRMLDMGFIRPVRAIAAKIPTRRQTALFSATMAPEVATLAAGLLRDPIRVEATPPATTVRTIAQRVIRSAAKGKRSLLNTLLADPALAKVLIFARTKHGADRVAKNLEIDGHQVAAIHGNKSQNARQAALKGFAAGDVRLLVATDIAARGIDVQGITHVINFELPDDAENYVHRIGRTARNGASGEAITLVDAGEADKLRAIEKLIRQRLPTSGEFGAGAPASALIETSLEAPARRPEGQQAHRRSGQRARPAGQQQRPAGQQARRPQQPKRQEQAPKGAAKPQHGRSARQPAANGDAARGNWWEKPSGAKVADAGQRGRRRPAQARRNSGQGAATIAG